MSGAFDPYHKWLGIPPKQQPPHHYRLLGLQPLEDDTEVIDAAANRVMAYLQGQATGEHQEASQRLMNHIATARVTLLNEDRKAAYDDRLRQKLSRQEGTAQHSTQPPRKNAGRTEALHDDEPLRLEPEHARTTAWNSGAGGPEARGFAASLPEKKPSPSERGKRRRRSLTGPRTTKKQKNPVPLILGGAGTVVVAVVAVIVLISTTGGQQSENPVGVDRGKGVASDSSGERTAKAKRRPARVDRSDSIRHRLRPADENPLPTGRTASGPASSPVADPGTASVPPPQGAAAAPDDATIAAAVKQIEGGQLRKALAMLQLIIEKQRGTQDEIHRAARLAGDIRFLLDSEQMTRNLVRQFEMSGLTTDRVARLKASSIAYVQRLSHPKLTEIHLKRTREILPEAQHRYLKQKGINPDDVLAKTNPAPKPKPDQAEPEAEEPAPEEPKSQSPDKPDTESETQPETPPEVDPPAGAEQYLADAGLRLLGKRWVLKDEARLKPLLASLPARKLAVEKQQKTLGSVMQRIEQVRQRVKLANKQRAQYIVAGQPVPLQLDAFLKQYGEQVQSIQKIHGIESVRQSSDALFSALKSLIDGYYAVKHQIDVLRKRYGKLSADQKVLAAIKVLGKEKHAIGETSALDAAEKQLAKYDAYVLGDNVACRHEMPPAQVPYEKLLGVFNDRTSAWIQFKPDAQFNFLPDSVVKAAGIQIPPGATPVTLTYGNAGRTFPVRRARLSVIRLGSHVLQDVEFMILPPEAEDLGLVINNDAFKGFETNLDLERFRFQIKRPGAPAAAGD